MLAGLRSGSQCGLEAARYERRLVAGSHVLRAQTRPAGDRPSSQEGAVAHVRAAVDAASSAGKRAGCNESGRRRLGAFGAARSAECRGPSRRTA